MQYTVVIPARYGSSRLPGKPLADIGGQPMVLRVCERAQLSGAQQVVVATDDGRIAEVCEAAGSHVCMTREDHPSGTDRIEEVCQQLGLTDDDIVVNVQGDEPLIPPAVIEQVAANLAAHPEASIATLSEPIKRAGDLFNPNIVKVIADKNGLALYFSRAPIPWDRDGYASGEPAADSSVHAQRHLGIYAYRVGLLRRYVTWPPHPLEQTEALEQLRAMANGERIHVAEACEYVPPGVDTEEDLAAVRRLLQES